MIDYLVGDATLPVERPACIVHVTNDVGAWGRGFVLALERRWPGMGARWRLRGQRLGDMAIEEAESQLFVAHCCAQRGLRSALNPVPLDYTALRRCLRGVANIAHVEGWTLAMPRIGCGLAGGAWSRVEAIIQEELRNVRVHVFDLEAK